ncbi:MAG TPA: hypothetical protein VFT29_06235 [Gemmatimonadaceae bacterium]|nr:hypothetical protein [Gemmatimonadaceae bacterium]
MQRPKSVPRRVIYALSVVLFGIMSLVPGLFGGGSEAFAGYGGGGGGGGGSGPCSPNGSVAYSYVCSTCYLLSCTPLPCHYDAAKEGTRYTYTCVNGNWQSTAVGGVGCGYCFG